MNKKHNLDNHFEDIEIYIIELKKAREQLAKIQADPELMERIILEEAYEMDVATSINQARREGEKEAKLETAKKMLEKGVDIEFILEVTGLAKEEIEELKD